MALSENVHPRADELDSLTTRELVEVMHEEDRRAVAAIRPQLAQIVVAIDEIAKRLRSGGRLHYFGAGTSGRLASVDASECAATFGIDADVVQAHDLGDGEQEDDPGRGDVAARSAVVDHDAAVFVSASGRTPSVLAGLEHAMAAGALVVAITCSPGSPLGAAADVAIEVETGPEVIAGSTRLKAGTVQKVILNMISTGAFTRTGHTHRGRMVGLVASNDKLRARAIRIVTELTGASRQSAQGALSDAVGNAKVAIVMLRCNLDVNEARRRISLAGGDLSAVLAETRLP